MSDTVSMEGARVVERCVTPRGEIVLRRRGHEFELIANGVFLMATGNRGSARLLVRAALDRCPRPSRVLVGGLGIGYSLAEAVAEPSVEQVVVVEVEEAVLRWQREHFGPLTGDAWRDPRVELVHADLLTWLGRATGKFDAVCLDIDNGPDWTVTPANAALYGEAGLDALRRVLRPGGVLAVWSAHTSEAFAQRLAERFDTVERLDVPVARGEPDRIYLGS